MIFNDEGKGLADKFTKALVLANTLVVKNSPFKNFNFPKYGEPIQVTAFHPHINQWEKEYLSLATHFASFTFDPNSPGSYSFGFEYNKINKCKISWAPQLPLTVAGTAPSNNDCCLAIKVKVAEHDY